MNLPRTTPDAPAGFKGLRGAIIVELKRAGALTAADLGERLGASLNAVRHHLKELEAESLVSYRRERRGVGAPTFAYALTARADGLFPQRYEATLLELLETLSEREGRQAAVELLQARYEGLARRLAPEVESAPADRRADVVRRALLDEGFMAEWHGSASGGVLTEHHCAIRALAERFPEVCDAEARFFESVLGASVERRAHIVRGCNACEYVVKFEEKRGVE